MAEQVDDVADHQVDAPAEEHPGEDNAEVAAVEVEETTTVADTAAEEPPAGDAPEDPEAAQPQHDAEMAEEQQVPGLGPDDVDDTTVG